jgi:uncharacterized protein YkwD
VFRPSRVTLVVLLCALLGVAGWVTLPSLSEYATRSQAAPAAEIETSASPVQRTGRVTRNQRLKAAPSPSRKPSADTGPLTGDAALEAEVIELVNAERRRARCPEVHLDKRLRSAARGHSADMARHNEMSHEGSDGSSPWDRAERAGYDAALSENVAVGYGTAEAVMDGWMNSPGHRDNILNCEARATGVGLAHSANGTPYWTQMFGRV